MAMRRGGDASFTGYRRRIRIVPGAGRIDVDMEDDAHRFGVSVMHDGTTVSAVETREPRHPWTTCPAAGAYLRERMAGVPLADAAGHDDQRQHCTHLYDLFVLAARHASDAGPTLYDIRVADARDGVKRAEIDRDGATLLRWNLGPADPDGAVPGGDFRALEAWSRTLPEDRQETARMLRRGVLVSGGRGLDFPAGQSAAMMPRMAGACFTFQPQRAAQAINLSGTMRDFSADPDRLLMGERDDRYPEGHPDR